MGRKTRGRVKRLWPDARTGQVVVGEYSTLSTIRENFTGFWKTWRCELAKREYALLDELLPGRVKSAKEWMVETGYAGAYKPVLKDVRDRASGQTAV
jgi:hypothetical protein